MKSDTAPPAAAGADGSRLIAVDALRGIAALGVVTFHVLPKGDNAHYPLGFLGPLHLDLDAGLMVFFVISGALIGAPFIRAMIDGGRKPSLRNFAVRRSARIFPAFWVALVALLLVNGVAVPWWQPLLHAALLQNVVPGQVDQLLYPAWTLEIEACFYVGIALVGWWVFRRGVTVRPNRAGLVVLGMWVGSVLCILCCDLFLVHISHGAPVDSSAGVILKYTMPGQMAYICPGLLLAIAATRAARREGGWWARLERLVASPRALLVAIGLCVAVGAIMTEVDVLPVRDLHRAVFSLAAGLMVAGAIRYEMALRPYTTWLLPLGLVTYSLYLWHVVVIQILAAWGFGEIYAGLLTFPLKWVLVSGSSMIAAGISYFLIERPALRWSRRRGNIRALGSETVSPPVGAATEGAS